MGKATLAVWSLLLVLTVLVIATWVRGSYQYESEIGSFWSLADKSSTVAKKAEYIDQFVAALDKQGFQGRYNAVIYPTLDNSFDRNLEALKSLQGRLHEIQNMDVSSFQYQTAIQQITQQEQGEAAAMLSVFEGVWWLERHPLLWDWYFAFVICGLCVLGLVGIGFSIAWAES